MTKQDIMNQYDDLTDENDHDGAAMALTNLVGSDRLRGAMQIVLEEIAGNIELQGYAEPHQIEARNGISRLILKDIAA